MVPIIESNVRSLVFGLGRMNLSTGSEITESFVTATSCLHLSTSVRTCPLQASHLRHLFGVAAGAASNIVDSSNHGEPSSGMLLEVSRGSTGNNSWQMTQVESLQVLGAVSTSGEGRGFIDASTVALSTPKDLRQLLCCAFPI